MDEYAYVIGCVLPYVTVPLSAVLVAGRVWTWLKQYDPAVALKPGPGSVYRTWSRQYRSTIRLFPAVTRTRLARLGRTVRGLLLFSGLLKRDPALWVGSWLLHVSLLAVILAHLGLPGRPVLGPSQTSVLRAGGAVLAAALLCLLARRVLLRRVRQVAEFRDYAVELVLLGLVATGIAAARSGAVDAGSVRAYVSGLLAFRGVPPPSDPAFLGHLLLFQVLLLRLPRSHLLHAPGIFLSRALMGSSDALAGTFGAGRRRGASRARRPA